VGAVASMAMARPHAGNARRGSLRRGDVALGPGDLTLIIDEAESRGAAILHRFA